MKKKLFIGKKMLFLTAFSSIGTLKAVILLGKNEKNGLIYFVKFDGRSDCTTKDFLFDYPDAMEIKPMILDDEVRGAFSHRNIPFKNYGVEL